ncbi:dihydrolipoyl dehydrogenase [Sporomusaceae bacterium FL31]|nr:dihydrolipoyl dehydrogenase [Sporomusaceae bacterium FL31]GCE34629.1 dihydrolipoyl dehydrogenase [Sporomusaceae bacterium]
MVKKRLVIVGGGPGGYVAAVRAAQLGADVSLVEKDKVGGTCLNRGCIPTKVILHSAELFQALKSGARSGILADNIRIDWPSVLQRKKSIVSGLVAGVAGLLKANGVKVFQGTASLLNDKTLEIVSNQEKQVVAADGIVLAVGSEPAAVSISGAGLPGVIDSTQALELSNIPRSLLIVGGGVIGLEFAAMYGALGTAVTVVEMQDQVLPGVDQEMAAMLQQELTREGVVFHTRAKIRQIAASTLGLTAEVEAGGKVLSMTAEYILVAVGRKPSIARLGIEAAGIAVNHSGIVVNEQFQTNTAGIYAIGDCNGKTLLAHAASAQGVAAVEHFMGHKPGYFSHIIPACIYTTPEFATVGLTEEQAKQSGRAVKVGKFPLSGNGKALIENSGKGLIKIIAGVQYGEILGVQILGPRATDIIAEAALAIRLEATVEELITTIHAHPTISEAVAEAALAVYDQAVHWPPKDH